MCFLHEGSCCPPESAHVEDLPSAHTKPALRLSSWAISVSANQGCLPQEGQPHSESPHRLGAPCAHASSLSFCPIQAIALIGSLEEKQRQASSSCCPGGRCFHVFPNSPASNKFTSFFILCPISRSVLSPTFLFDRLTKKRLKFVKYNVELTFSIDHAWGRSSFYISSIRGFYGTIFNSP